MTVENPTGTQRTRWGLRLLSYIAAGLLGATLAVGALVATGTSYLTPPIVMEKLVDCIGADDLVAQGGTTATPPSAEVAAVRDGFRDPIAIASVSESQLLVAERSGVITLMNVETDARETVLDLRARIDSTVENGLLGIALHPRFGQGGERRLFMHFNRTPDGAIVIASIQLSNDLEAAVDTLRALQVIPHEDGWHAGGGLGFLPDGRLLAGIGDDSKPNEAQNRSSMHGKILAFDVDDPTSGPSIFASGLRNPFRIAIDELRGELWVADVGQFCIEEVNRIALDQAEGANFGWPLYEGSRAWPRYVSSDYGYGDGDEDDSAESTVEFIEPITTYLHEKGGACAVIGGAVAGDWYLFVDYCDGIVRGIPVDATAGTQSIELLNLNADALSVGVIGVVRDAAGRIWLLDKWGGALMELTVTP